MDNTNNKDIENSTDKSLHTKGDNTMNATQPTIYNEQKFLAEFEESLKEMKQMRKSKTNTNTINGSSWRNLLKKDK